MSATLTEVRPWNRCLIGGTQVLLGGDVIQTEQLEGWVTTVAEIEIAETPALAQGAAVTLDAVDLAAATVTPQYAGILNRRQAASFPNRVVWRCLGPLHRLRRAPGANHDLTGKTDGEAVKYILDQCNVVYDADDIQDAGYVLGAQTAVKWQIEQPGWDVVKELDGVFGMATLEVGAGRVVRFAYDRAPDAANISRTYTRGVDADFWSNERETGDLDAIQNLWHITGANWQDDDKCTLTVWGRAAGSNAAFESSAVRVRGQTFSSEVIQDEALAGAVAERMMRWWNRQPDVLTVQTANDPNISPGDVIGVSDNAYGIGLTTAADTLPYLVLTVDRRGHDMTLSCVGGAAGTTGTITTGVDRVCNKTTTDFPIPGSFDFPAIGFPPLVPWAAYDCAVHGAPGGEGTCPETCAALTDPAGTCASTATIDGQSVTSASWLMSGTVTLSASTDIFRVGVTALDGDYGLRIGGLDSYLLEGIFQQRYQFIAASRVEHLAGTVPVGVACAWALKWDHASREFKMTFSHGGETWCETIDVPAGGLEAGTGIVTVTGSPTRADETFSYDCTGGGGGGGLITADWTPLYGNWDLATDFAKFIGTTINYSGYAYFNHPFDGSHTATVTGHVALSGDLSDFAPVIGLGGAAEELAEAGFDWSAGSGASVYVESAWTGGGFANPSVASATTFDFSIVYDFDAGTETVVIDAGDPTVITLGTPPAAEVYLFIGCSGNHLAMEMDVTDIAVTVGS